MKVGCHHKTSGLSWQLEGWHPLEKMKNPTFLSYFLDEMEPDEMQASDEDERCKDDLAKIEMNRLKMKKMRWRSETKMSRNARDEMLKMKLIFSSVAAVGWNCRL